MRRWLVRIALAALAIPAALAAALGALVWPYFRDDRVLDDAVRVAAIDWRDFGRDKAETRLKYEIDAQGVGLWVGDDSCAFVEGAPLADGEREIRCMWRAFVVIPGLSGRGLPLSFVSVARVGADGDVR